MRLTMRIYKRHDPDLLALYYAADKEYDIKNKIKNTIREYINGVIPENILPNTSCIKMFDLPPKVNFHIQLDNTEDKDIIDWLKTIKQGRRNNLIKNILRSSYPPIIAPYYNESEFNKFNLNEKR